MAQNTSQPRSGRRLRSRGRSPATHRLMARPNGHLHDLPVPDTVALTLSHVRNARSTEPPGPSALLPAPRLSRRVTTGLPTSRSHDLSHDLSPFIRGSSPSTSTSTPAPAPSSESWTIRPSWPRQAPLHASKSKAFVPSPHIDHRGRDAPRFC